MTAAEYAEREDLLVWVSEGCVIPAGYGVAWRDHRRRVSACIPIPLNLVVGWTRKAWHWAMCGIRPSVLDHIEYEAYWHGRTAGRRQGESLGWSQGHSAGYREGYADALRAIRRVMREERGS